MIPVKRAAAFAFTLVLVHQLHAAPDLSSQTAQEITAEATRPGQSDAGRPLPIAAHWCVTPFNGTGFSPEYELKLISEGHHIMPGFAWPGTEKMAERNWKPGDPAREKFYLTQKAEFEPSIREAARLHLPIAFLGTQWESDLSWDKQYFDLPADQNPNVVTTEGKILHAASPFGPIKYWQQVGKEWVDSRLLRDIQQLYPQPPLIFLISNNEAGKLYWTDCDKCRDYVNKYGAKHDDDFKRKVLSEGYMERYRAMLDSMRGALTNNTWKKNVRFMGYEAGPGPIHFGRWPLWKTYSGYYPGMLDWSPYVWDGTSPSYYTWEWMPDHDYTLWSPQVEAQNWVFMLDQIHEKKRDFWFELSTWDSDQPGHPNDSRRFYLRQGQDYGPWRYEGFVQFGMWLTMPRTVREFRGWTDTVPRSGEYFNAIVNSVDRTYTNPILQKFWRFGKLVVNPAQQHPYQYDIPPEYKDVPRWFLLSTNLDTQKPWKARGWDNADYDEPDVIFPVFSLARVITEKGKRQWLVYAHSPLQARKNVKITVPDYGDIDVTVTQSGSFYLLTEGSKNVQTVMLGGPASLVPEISSIFPETKQPVNFAATDVFSPKGKLDDLTWDFGDGSIAKGETATHSYAVAGQYVTTLRAREQNTIVQRQVALFPGLTKEPGLVCRLLMTGTLDLQLKDQSPFPTPGNSPLTIIPDAAGCSNTGFLSGGKFIPDPERQTVLELNGDRSYVFINSSTDINYRRKFGHRTVSLWFKPKDVTARQVLYAEGGTGGGMNLYVQNGQLHGGVWATSIWPGTFLHSEALEAGKWHHGAISLDNDTDEVHPDAVTLWLDGVRAGSGPGARLPSHNGTIIGRDEGTRYEDGPGKLPDAFVGRISDLRIYNRALSVAEMGK